MRGGSLKRRPSRRDPKKKFIIYTEGRNTEPGYLEALQRLHEGALIDIEIIGAAGVAATVANSAIEKKKDINRQSKRSSYSKNDEVWALFDKDGHPLVWESITRCGQHGVQVGFSNPCFEVWLLLHYEYYDRPGSNKDAEKRLKQVCPDYDPDKGKMLDFHAIMDRVPDAENRAENQERTRVAEGNVREGPYTTVYHLTRSLREAVKSFG